MNTYTKHSWLLLLLIPMFLVLSCSKTSETTPIPNPPPPPPPVSIPILPTVTTNQPTQSNSFSYTITGSTTHAGNASITQQGICWGSFPNPTLSDSVLVSSSTYPSNIVIPLPRLWAKKTYYFRAFATNSVGTAYGNQIMLTTPMDIGFLYAGGIVFDFDSSYAHGLVAAEMDQGSAIPWAPGNLFATSVSTTSNNGVSNTNNIISTYGNAGTYAAKLCRDYRGGNYTNWYLPSGEEMNTLKLRENSIPNFPASQPFTSFYYWSSTQYNNANAWAYDFSPSYYNVNLRQKNMLLAVRAIRKF